MFLKKYYDKPISIEMINMGSENNLKLVTPKELKGIKSFFKFKFENEKTINLYLDDYFNLWYKDLSIIVGSKWEEPEEKVSYLKDKAFIKIEGLYERKDEHFIDIMSDLRDSSEKYYNGNIISDNLYLERLYEIILREYLKEIKRNKKK